MTIKELRHYLTQFDGRSEDEYEARCDFDAGCGTVAIYPSHRVNNKQRYIVLSGD